MQNKEFQIYILHQNDQTIIRKINDDHELYYIQTQEFVANLVNEINSSCSNISFVKNNSKFYVDDLNNLIINVNNKITKINTESEQKELNKQVSQIESKIANLKASLNFINRISRNLNINNIQEIDNLKSQLNEFINENGLKQISQCLSTLSQNITNLNGIINNLVYFFNILTVINFKIFDIIKKSTNLLNDFCLKQESEKNYDISNLTIKSILIDQNQYPILVFEEKKLDSNSKKLKACNIFFNILTQYFENVSQIYEKIKTGKGKTEGIEEYFFNEVNNFKSELSNIIDKNQSYIKMVEEFDNFSNKFNNIDKRIPLENYQEQSTSDFCWNQLLNIAKYHIPSDSNTILNMINSIFSLYFENVGNSPMKKTYEEFISICKTNKQITSQTIQEIIKEIQASNNYFYFDILFQISLKNLLDSSVFASRFYDICKEDYDDNDALNNYGFIKDGDFGTEITTSKLCYDKKFNLVLELDYKADIDEISKNLRDKEINISENEYSKFIVHSIYVNQKDCNRIVIPYFSSKTISSILISKNKKRIELTYVDKIVIILEIANALKDLHDNNKYHGNLSSQSVFINSKNDAYLFGFSYDRRFENQQTKLGGPFYYHPPEKISEDQIIPVEEYKDDKDCFERNQLADIYSFGVLMHEIITDVEVHTRFKNAIRKDIFKSLKESFFVDLMNESKCFQEDGYLIDQRGNCIVGLKEIIEKCMKVSPDERYSSFHEIINSIKSLTIFEVNKEEIEYRIKNASKSSDFQCSLANLVESYYRGQVDCLNDINKSFEIVFRKETPEKPIDIIKNIFNTFNLKKNEDYSNFFEDIFNFIIQRHQKSKTVKNDFFNYSDKLFLLSMEKNIEQKSKFDFIVPISTLGNFIEHNKDKIGDLIPTWIYFISKELSIIHSINLYHGKLSMDNIGIYYNHETQTFIPSIILFYSIHIQNHGQHKLYSYYDPSYSEETINEKYQKKDIKNLCKIINQFELIPNNIKKEIEQANTVNKIVCVLYNFINKNSNIDQKEIFDKNKNFSHDDYSSYQITYPVMYKLFFIMENKFSFEGIFLEFETILIIINEFLSNLYLNISKPIIESIPQESNVQHKTESIGISQLFINIKDKCSLVWSSIFNQIEFETINHPTIEKKKKKKREKRKDFVLIYNIRKIEEKKWFTKPVDRKLEISELYYNSIEFLIRRYIFCLNPTLDYRLSIKISNKSYSHYQDVQLKTEHIKTIVGKLGFEDVTNENGCVVVAVNLRSRNIAQGKK